MADRKGKGKGDNLDELEDYARQIWLAGLGAYTRLGKEGGKLFEALIREGEEAEKLASKVSLDGAKAKVRKARKKLADKLDGLEERFDKRLQDAAERMRLASQADLEALARRVDELGSMVEKLAAAPGPATAAAKSAPARRPAAKKPAAASSDKTATAAPKPATRRRSTTPKAATRGKTSPAPATDAAPGTPTEM